MAIAAFSIFSLAQQKPAAPTPPPPPDRVIFEQMLGPDGPMPPPGPGDFVFMATEMSFGGKLVKGAPYSAEAVTESVQTLSDGNRITNRSTSTVYRDSEGRTRRDQTFKAHGPFANSGEPAQTIFIHDTVAGVSYILDSRTHIARKMVPMQFKFDTRTPPPDDVKPGNAATKSQGQIVERIEIHPDGLERRTVEAGVATGVIRTRNENAQTESLGKQNIEGVEADGTRTTVTIPAGEVGNERPIEIVSERWYSPELQTIVMTRHTDPRFGESTYRLTNINREEPAHILFEVPGGYTIKEGPMASEQIHIRKPANPE